MNIFRLAGDMTHLLSIMVLLLKIHATRSCRGISPSGSPVSWIKVHALHYGTEVSACAAQVLS